MKESNRKWKPRKGSPFEKDIEFQEMLKKEDEIYLKRDLDAEEKYHVLCEKCNLRDVITYNYVIKSVCGSEKSHLLVGVPCVIDVYHKRFGLTLRNELIDFINQVVSSLHKKIVNYGVSIDQIKEYEEKYFKQQTKSIDVVEIDNEDKMYKLVYMLRNSAKIIYRSIQLMVKSVNRHLIRRTLPIDKLTVVGSFTAIEEKIFRIFYKSACDDELETTNFNYNSIWKFKYHDYRNKDNLGVINCSDTMLICNTDVYKVQGYNVNDKVTRCFIVSDDEQYIAKPHFYNFNNKKGVMGCYTTNKDVLIFMYMGVSKGNDVLMVEGEAKVYRQMINYCNCVLECDDHDVIFATSNPFSDNIYNEYTVVHESNTCFTCEMLGSVEDQVVNKYSSGGHKIMPIEQKTLHTHLPCFRWRIFFDDDVKLFEFIKQYSKVKKSKVYPPPVNYAHGRIYREYVIRLNMYAEFCVRKFRNDGYGNNNKVDVRMRRFRRDTFIDDTTNNNVPRILPIWRGN